MQNNPAPDSVTVQLVGFSSATTHTEGDTMTVIANDVTDHGHPNFPGDESYRVGDATYKRLLKIDNPNHLTELNLPVTDLSVTTVSAYGDADTTLLVAVLEDTRSVLLSRPNATGERTEYENGIPVTYGDTIYTYLQGAIAIPSKQTVVTQFEGTAWSLIQQKSAFGIPFGPSFPDVDYVWGITGPTVTKADTIQNLVLNENNATMNGQSAYPNGQDTAREQKAVSVDNHGAILDIGINPPRWQYVPAPSPQDIVFTYNATDRGDKAKATAIYKLKVHDEIEYTTTPAPTTVAAPRRYSYILDANGQLVNITGSGLVELGTSKEFSTSTEQGFDIGVSGGIPISRIFKFLKPYLDSSKAPTTVTDPNTNQQHAPDSPLEFSMSYHKSWGGGMNNVYPLPYEIVTHEKAYAIAIRTYKWQLRPFRRFDVDGEVKPDVCGVGPGSGITDDGSFWRTDYQERTDDAEDVKWLKVPDDFYPSPGDPVDWSAAEASFFNS